MGQREKDVVQIDQARVRARAIAEGPADTNLLDQAKNALPEGQRGVWEAFHDEFVLMVRASTERRAAWTVRLAEASAATREALAKAVLLKHNEREFQGAVEQWQTERDVFSVWRSLPQVNLFSYESHYWTGLLLRVHPEEGLRSLERFPYPAIMSEILTASCRDDRELILELICAAPNAFDASGAWCRERHVTALLIAALIVEHSSGLLDMLNAAERTGTNPESAELKRAIEDAERHELPIWMANAFDLLLRRVDGPRIALAYLGHLGRTTLLGHGGRPRRPLRGSGYRSQSVYSLALEALAGALRRVSVTVSQVRQEWVVRESFTIREEAEQAKGTLVRRRRPSKRTAREGEGARTLHAEGLPYLIGALALTAGETAREGEATQLWSWSQQLMAGRDPGLSLVSHGNSFAEVSEHLAVVLSQLSDPGTALRVSYRDLESLRRRALFPDRYDELYDDLESVILLRIGLHTAAHIRQIQGKEGSSLDLFFWVFEQARRLWLTAVLDAQRDKAQLLVTCFAFMPFLFGDALGKALEKVIPFLATDARMLADGCAQLRANGIDAITTRQLANGAGADLDAALRDAHQWSELTGRKEDFPDYLRELAAELGVDLSAADTSSRVAQSGLA